MVTAMASRGTPQRPRSSRYITREGAQKLRDELAHLWSVERPRVTQEVADAAALGDRSENAEYIYGKRRLREIDRRLRFLAKRIESLVVVDEPPGERDRIFFGAWVTLEDEDGGTVEYRIVGADESDPKTGRISIDSPVARALLGKRVDDEVMVRRARGEAIYTVLQIRYT
jgi:transcription elongation factor GreB